MEEQKKKNEDPIARRRLKKKVLERWENEGGSICTDSGNTPRSSAPGNRVRQTPTLSRDSSTKENDHSTAPKKPG
jgi:hypothetical protein